MDIAEDPRFLRGVESLNAGDFFEASEEFEDLFFEAVRDEIDFIRVFLQVSTGAHHVERGQLVAAIERLEESLRYIPGVTNDRGFDLDALDARVKGFILQIRARREGREEKLDWPRVGTREGG